MSLSPFEHPFLSGLLGDEETASQFHASADLRCMLQFEGALARAQAQAGMIPADAAGRIAAVAAQFSPDMAELRQGVAQDGVVIPDLVRQLRKAVQPEDAALVHLGATSQDVIDSSLMMRLTAVLRLHATRLDRLVTAFESLRTLHGQRQLMGHTRMQAAIPITAGDRIESWTAPLLRHRGRLRACLEQGLPLQFGGAAGTLDKLGDKADEVRAALAGHLGLANMHQWQNQRDHLVEVANLFCLISDSLGKFGQDIALMAQMQDELVLSGGGGSSAMPHKQNPVGAEILVTLARYNATQISGMHHAMVHEQERSGAAWTLEWMLLPSIAVTAGTALITAEALVGKIRSLGRD
ncbi:3-carboxy-cis,cis-muconate cycloisomerase [Rhizobium sp. SSA_523]|uniref:3-carboxy-cis,cis-muconate cycloisomerase n=1 Tax=Rhizobium sp. SSA_523 TaxID=2952477 RepID=UPI002091CFF5|nr:3-carboxy-cis,cis-muconate cycloisomerase [Rhizobium sp. SSA_523]MCO5733250.1 3-carboxy-cis,cis-muconate cycloisomerase [Rhizobium sp. SSA_523]WKC21764.1 3-carboxy-cis,cis-muconate cycloisomerase [Rhizobium sp. SSA_523]